MQSDKFLIIFWVILATLVFSGCVDDSSPIWMEEAGLDATQIYINRAKGATAAALLAREEARKDQAFQATMQAARTALAAEVEIALLAAQGTATQASYQAQAEATQAAIGRQATATSEAANALATRKAGDVQATVEMAGARATVQALDHARQKQDVELRTKQLMAEVWAITRWLSVVLVIAVFTWVLARTITVWAKARRGRWSAIYPNMNGDKPVIAIGDRLIDMDLAAYPIVDPAAPGVSLLNAENQLVVKEADQKIDLARAIAPAGSSIRAMLEKNDGYQVLGARESPPEALLPAGVTGILDAEWKDGIKSDFD